MVWSRALWFGAGVLTGVIVSQALVRPEGRALTKAMLKRGLAAQDWLLTHVELFREDLADLVAEAREEREQEKAAAEAAAEPAAEPAAG